MGNNCLSINGKIIFFITFEKDLVQLMKSFLKIISFLLFFVVLASCTSDDKKKNYKNQVIINQLGEPRSINPISYSSSSGTDVARNIFYRLMDMDYKTRELIPVLLKSKPVEEKMEGVQKKYTMELRPEAKWENGNDVLAKDVEFSLKLLKLPKINNVRRKAAYEDFIDFQIDKENPKKFSITIDKPYFLTIYAIADIAVLPKYIYDKSNVLGQFQINEIDKNFDKIGGNTDLIDFANAFNSLKYQKDIAVGAGPYKIESRKPKERIVLVKKKNWWGNQLKNENMFFDIKLDKIIFDVIPDMNTVVSAIKREKIDLARGISPENFLELQKNKRISELYNFETPLINGYIYLGLNLKNKVLQDIAVRKALAHLVDIEKIIKKLNNGLGKPALGPILETDKAYNNNLPKYNFSPEKAKEILANAGWKDSNGNGILDKKIDGKTTELKLRYSFLKGNDVRKNTGLLLQEQAKKANIEIELVAQDVAVHLESLNNKDFDIYYGVWIFPVGGIDLKQLFHSESIVGGSNYCSFNNNKIDGLIDKSRVEPNEKKRNEMMKEIQQIIVSELPYIFMSVPKNRLIIHKKYKNTKVGKIHPGYYEAGFEVNKDF